MLSEKRERFQFAPIKEAATSWLEKILSKIDKILLTKKTFKGKLSPFYIRFTNCGNGRFTDSMLPHHALLPLQRLIRQPPAIGTSQEAHGPRGTTHKPI